MSSARTKHFLSSSMLLSVELGCRQSHRIHRGGSQHRPKAVHCTETVLAAPSCAALGSCFMRRHQHFTELIHRDGWCSEELLWKRSATLVAPLWHAQDHWVLAASPWCALHLHGASNSCYVHAALAGASCIAACGWCSTTKMVAHCCF